MQGEKKVQVGPGGGWGGKQSHCVRMTQSLYKEKQGADPVGRVIQGCRSRGEVEGEWHEGQPGRRNRCNKASWTCCPLRKREGRRGKGVGQWGRGLQKATWTYMGGIGS